MPNEVCYSRLAYRLDTRPQDLIQRINNTRQPQQMDFFTKIINTIQDTFRGMIKPMDTFQPMMFIDGGMKPIDYNIKPITPPMQPIMTPMDTIIPMPMPMPQPIMMPLDGRPPPPSPPPPPMQPIMIPDTGPMPPLPLQPATQYQPNPPNGPIYTVYGSMQPNTHYISGVGWVSNQPIQQTGTPPMQPVTMVPPPTMQPVTMVPPPTMMPLDGIPMTAANQFTLVSDLGPAGIKYWSSAGFPVNQASYLNYLRSVGILTGAQFIAEANREIAIGSGINTAFPGPGGQGLTIIGGGGSSPPPVGPSIGPGGGGL